MNNLFIALPKISNTKTYISDIYNAKGDCEVIQEGLRVEQPPAPTIKSLGLH